MQIDTNATHMSYEEAEALLSQLYHIYHDREVDETAHNDLIPILQEKGFVGLVYVLDIITNSDEMKRRARKDFSKIWETELEYSPTKDERGYYQKQIRYFPNSAKKEFVRNINKAESLRQEASSYLKADDLDNAQNILDKAVTFEPTPWLVWHDHGAVRFRKREYENAIPSYHKAIELNSDDSFVQSCEDLKWCYGNLGKKDSTWLEQGLTYFQKVIKKHPKRSIAWHECGWMSWKLGEIEVAMDYYLKALELNPDLDPDWSYSDFKACFDSLEEEEAFAYFESKANNGSQNWVVWDFLGWLNWKHKNDPNSAIDAYKKSIEYIGDKGWFYTYLHLGWCYKESNISEPKKYHLAFDAFEEANKIEKDKWDAWHGMGWAKEQLGGPGDWTKAIDYYQHALRLNPQSTWSWVGIGRSYRKKEKPQFINSWEAYLEVLKLAPEYGHDYQAAESGISLLDNKQSKELRKILVAGYNLAEIEALCFDLDDVEFEELSGDALTPKVISLIKYFERRNRLEDLIQAIRTERPNLIPLTVPAKSSS